MIEAFVYCWTDHKTQKLYVGSHKGSIDDGYICSSKYMMKEYTIRPQDFTRQIVAEGKFQDIRKLEEVILKSVNAALNEQFYNKHNNDGKFYNTSHNEDTKKKISKSMSGNKNPFYGKKLSATHKSNVSEALRGKKNPFFGKQHDPEKKREISRKASETMKGHRPKNIPTGLWWNNGLINKRSSMIPGPEWIRGKVKRV